MKIIGFTIHFNGRNLKTRLQWHDTIQHFTDTYKN